MQTKGQFLLSKMCEVTGTGSGLCDEVAILLVCSRYTVHCQREREREGVREKGWTGRQLTLYLTAKVHSPVTVFSLSRRKCNIHPEKCKKMPSKRIVGLAPLILKLGTISLTEYNGGRIKKSLKNITTTFDCADI